MIPRSIAASPHSGTIRAIFTAALDAVEPMGAIKRTVTRRGNRLQVGDVVQLDRKVTDEVQVAIGDKVVFVGHPGTRNGNVGIRITRAVGK